MMLAAAVSAAALGVGYVIGCGYWRKKDLILDFEETYIPMELRHTKYTAELILAVEVALKAGKRMKAHIDSKGTISEQALDYSTKSNVADIATVIDEENETMIIKAIQRRFPSHKVIGEEMTGTSDVIDTPSTTEPTWIIDPVDGTTNFANGLPLTCVSIGLCDPATGQPVMGCVYAPATNELFLTVKNCGAYRNQQRIFASNRNKGSGGGNLLKKAVVVFEFGSILDPQAIDKMMRVFGNILKRGVRASRSIGSGVLDLCYVAAGGKVDAVYCGVAGEQWKPWDYCAGSLMVTEANGCITTLLLPQKESQSESVSASETETILPPFDIYAKSMIAGVSTAMVQELRTVIHSALL
jgi:myo-inositol-1(or 4)-monophosphatase